MPGFKIESADGPQYAELQATSNFSFLEGGSHPHELAIRAGELGLSAIAITDRNSLAGIVRAHIAARELDVKLVIGCRLSFMDGAPEILCYPADRAAYGRLCRLLTLGKSGEVREEAGGSSLLQNGRIEPRPEKKKGIPKGGRQLVFQDFIDRSEGQIVAVLPPAGPRRERPEACR